jgi:HlyD family secretion protein
VVQTVVASGRVIAPQRVQIGATAIGRVLEVAVDEGDRVAPGALLVRLDEAEARAALASAEAAARAARARLARARGTGVSEARAVLDQSEARLERASADLARAEQLAARGAVSAQELDRARAESTGLASARDAARAQLGAASGVEGRAAAADLARAEAEVSAARARLDQTRITSPVDAIVVTRSIEPGDVAQLGAVLLELSAEGPAALRIDPDESTLAQLAVGQPALASAEAFPDQRFAARVSYLAPAVDPQRGTIEVELEILEPPAYLRPDMTVSVDVEVARRADALVLPIDAVHDVGTGAPWAWLVRDGVVRRSELRLGAVGQTSVEILEGAPEGTRAIVDDVVGLTDGARVRGRAER